MVGCEPDSVLAYSAIGDQSRQRPEQLEFPYSIHETDGGVCRPEQPGNRSGVLSALSQ